MRSRINVSTVGWLARSKVSLQPVHSWPESQMTGGRLRLATASAILAPVPRGSPMPAAAMVQNFRKSRRDTMPECVETGTGSRSFIDPPFIIDAVGSFAPPWRLHGANSTVEHYGLF